MTNSVPAATPYGEFSFWSSTASSADGTVLVAAVYRGGIWISQATPSPQLNLSISNQALNFSWPVPSANFVLQQSSDLINWTTLTNQPALNFTNLQEQLTLAPTSNVGFFRLSAP